jgi:hypothetical protein
MRNTTSAAGSAYIAVDTALKMIATTMSAPAGNRSYRRAAMGFVSRRTQRLRDRMTPTIGREMPSDAALTGSTV